MSFFVYIHTCPNGKKYVGITTQSNPEYRWGKGGGYYNNKHFYKAICKYGWDNIEHEIFESDSESLMKFWEIILIHHYNSSNPKYGYNKSTGGESAKGMKHSEETKKKIGEGRRGHKHSEDTKKRMSESAIKRGQSAEYREHMHNKLAGRPSPMKGRKLSDETKAKMTAAKKLYWENKRNQNT